VTDQPGLDRLAWRYVTGGRLDGLPIQPGAPWPRRRRALWRLGPPTMLVAAAAEYSTHPAATEASLSVLTTAAAVRGAQAARRAWRTRRFRAVYIRPTLAALRPALGDAPVRLHVDPGLGTLMTRLAKPMSPAEEAVRAWYGARVEPVLRWAPDHVQRAAWAVQRAARPVTRHAALLRRPVADAGQRIQLDTAVPYLTVEQRQLVSSVIGAKIPAGELVESWDQVGPTVRATWTVRRRPPTHAGYADLAARFDQLEEWEFFIGLGAGGRKVVITCATTPHTSPARPVPAPGSPCSRSSSPCRCLARGGQVDILDRKGSHRWALGMPGVTYCTTPEQMHDAMIRAAVQADRRNAEALHQPEDWNPGYRRLVVAEELNAMMQQLKDYWAATRDKGDPKTSPAVQAFRNTLYMGRSAKVNVFAVAQMLTALTTGGPEARENFGVRALARYTKNNWQMLVPEAGMPRASRTQGRWQIVVGGEATETQVCFLSQAEAQLFVHKHRAVPASPPDRGSPLMASGQELSPGHGPVAGPAGTPADPRDELLTLRDAVDRRLLPWEHPAAKKRLQRARAAGRLTPEPAGQRGQADLYRAGDLLAWAESELIP
jgi:hypothetical protein